MDLDCFVTATRYYHASWTGNDRTLWHLLHEEVEFVHMTITTGRENVVALCSCRTQQNNIEHFELKSIPIGVGRVAVRYRVSVVEFQEELMIEDGLVVFIRQTIDKARDCS